MELIEEESRGRSGITNNYYGGVTNVINLKLTQDQVAVLGSGNNIAETINSVLNPYINNGHGK
jgi:hypothetical protein